MCGVLGWLRGMRLKGKSHPRRPDGTRRSEEILDADTQPPQRPLVALAARVGPEPERLGHDVLPLSRNRDRDHEARVGADDRLDQVNQAGRAVSASRPSGRPSTEVSRDPDTASSSIGPCRAVSAERRRKP